MASSSTQVAAVAVVVATAAVVESAVVVAAVKGGTVGGATVEGATVVHSSQVCWQVSPTSAAQYRLLACIARSQYFRAFHVAQVLRATEPVRRRSESSAHVTDVAAPACVLCDIAMGRPDAKQTARTREATAQPRSWVRCRGWWYLCRGARADMQAWVPARRTRFRCQSHQLPAPPRAGEEPPPRR